MGQTQLVTNFHTVVQQLDVLELLLEKGRTVSTHGFVHHVAGSRKLPIEPRCSQLVWLDPRHEIEGAFRQFGL